MPISLKNSYNAGDLITMLPGLSSIYAETGHKFIVYQVLNLPAFYYEGAEHPIKNSEGVNVCMNKKTFDSVRRLLVSQEYILDYKVFRGNKVDIDLDQTRDSRRIPLPYGNIHNWTFFVAPELACDLSKKWLFLPKSERTEGRVVINRTSRYQNPYIHYFFLNKYSDRLLFIGMEKECKDFNEKWGLNIEYLPTSDFYEVALAINSSIGFIGNQSACWHIADAMKVPRVLEYCPQFPNTHPTGANGYAALYQEALELYVKKMFENEY